MSLVQRLIKGSPLTAKEYDDNNLYLEALANSGGGSFDCSDLDACQTIIDIKDDIANIPVFDCSDLDACQTIIDIKDDLTGFFIAIDFEEVEPFSYVAPQDFTIDSIDNPDSISLVITVNGAPYTLEDPISMYDKIVITPDSVGFIKLNCTRI